MLNRRREKHKRESRDRRRKLVGAIGVMALGIGALGAYSFASQNHSLPNALPLTPSAIIRTTPDAPREVPPPVEPTK
jgi:hypothetical protein